MDLYIYFERMLFHVYSRCWTRIQVCTQYRDLQSIQEGKNKNLHHSVLCKQCLVHKAKDYMVEKVLQKQVLE